MQVKPLHKSPFSGPKQPLPVARHLLEPGLRQQQGAVAVAEYSQEEVGTVEQKAIFIIVKLRQGSGKERQGKARKGKYGER